MNTPDTEKVSVNMGLVDLGQIDLLVEQGFYTNRTDFIRTAVRNLIQDRAEIVQQQLKSRVMVIGVLSYGRVALEKLRSQGKTMEIRVVGIVHIARDVSPELALETIAAIKVFGALKASDEVKQALESRLEV